MTIRKMIDDRYDLICSDTHFSFCRKKPTISIYDHEKNIETKVASFNNKETFEWFLHILVGKHFKEVKK